MKACRLLVCLVIVSAALARADDAPPRRTARLLTVGNSLSQDATHFLDDLARAAGHMLVHHECAIGGGTLEQHWLKHTAHEKNPADPAGLYPSGKSLLEELRAEKWDVVTVQQVSTMSHDIASYRPYAGYLRDLIARHSPTAQIRVHQTWQYRADSWQFTGPDPLPNTPRSAEAMYAALSGAYREIAKELNAPRIPVGDAFHRAISSGMFADKPDPDFDFINATRPALPRQEASLYVGWHWKRRDDGSWKLELDDRHASLAGRYLGACVWFEAIFGESCEGNRFCPAGLDPRAAPELQRIAHATCAEAKR